MATIRVSEDGLRAVVQAVDSSADEATAVAGWLATGGLSQSLIGVLSGHGLSAVSLVAQAEELAARTALQSHLIRADADLARTWGNALVGSQVFATSSHDWSALVGGAGALAETAYGQRKWLARTADYLAAGKWGSYAATWRPFGHYARAYNLLGVGVLAIAGDAIGGSGGGVVSQASNLTTAAFTFGSIVKHRQKWTGFLGTKVVLKVAAPLVFAQAALDGYGLATTGYREVLHGDAQGHQQGVRTAIYAAKWADTLGSVAFAVAPFTGPAAPFLAAGGAAAMGLSALVRGTIFATDYLGEHPELMHQMTSVITSSALHSWAPIQPGHLGLSM